MAKSVEAWLRLWGRGQGHSGAAKVVGARGRFQGRGGVAKVWGRGQGRGCMAKVLGS